jgi:general L-amino acid transport system substrate-binding protein
MKRVTLVLALAIVGGVTGTAAIGGIKDPPAVNNPAAAPAAPTSTGAPAEGAPAATPSTVAPSVPAAAEMPARSQTLKAVQDRGVLLCGVSQGLPGFSTPDDKGNWTGLDVDVCRAIAAAVLNDPTKVKFLPLTAKDRFLALQSNVIDVLSRNTTWTLERDTKQGLFAGVTYYDGQGFLVKKSLKVNSALELSGASICVQTGTTTEQNLADYFNGNNMKYEVVAFTGADETVKAYESGRCDVFTSDVSQLYAERLKLANPADHVVLPEVISKEPLGPMVRHGDEQWFDIVKWTLFAMIDAEELGVTQKNVDVMAKSDKPDLKRAFGTDGNLGEDLGLTKDWFYRIIKAVGNYGESYERNVGAGSKLQISRGLNQLWNKGGIQYAPPIR